MRSRSVLLLSLISVLAGCAGETADSGPGVEYDAVGGKADEWSAADGPTITFADDWSEAADAAVVAGGAVRIRYDADRLPECRGDYRGRPAWTITAYAAVDGGDFEPVELRRSRTDAALFQGVIDELPAGDDLAFYFTVHNRWGCLSYDSNYGGDYHFAIGGGAPPAERPILVFAEGEVYATGPVRGGDEVVVRYDLDRLTECRGTTYGNPAWSITGWMSVDGAEATSFEVSRVEGSGRVEQDAVLTVPPGEELAIWFQNNSRWGCNAYDSNYGANWLFPIE